MWYLEYEKPAGGVGFIRYFGKNFCVFIKNGFEFLFQLPSQASGLHA